MRELTFTCLTPFGGSGLGAWGLQQAEITLPNLGVRARFELLGGIDNDPLACQDFELLTGVPELCADISKLTPADIRRHFGNRAPDLVLSSAPCTGSSALLSEAKAKTQKYQDLNALGLVWARLMIASWDEPPRLLLFENVPRIQARAAGMLKELRKLLKRAGYVLNEEHHCAGELGNLAQRRRRWLLVARHPRRCPPILYRPPLRRVRGCGEVLGQLPVPGTVAARAWGRMHVMPKLSWLNWVRLSLIPAGGDWRDLEGVLAEGQSRREQFKRHAVESWDDPVGVVGGTGSNGVANVADPRLTGYGDAFGVKSWEAPSGAVTGSAAPSRGAFTVADPRVFKDGYGVAGWTDPSTTIRGESLPSNGRFTVADPRVTCEPRSGAYGVQDWQAPSKTITGALQVDNGPAAVADPRTSGIIPQADNENMHWGKYRVHAWDDAIGTVTGVTRVGSGAPSVADPRVEDLRVSRAFDAGYAVLSWTEAARTIAGMTSVGCGAYSVADPRVDQAPESGGVWVGDPRKSPSFLPVIIAADGTWHRPLTKLELAALQGFPLRVGGKPLELHGSLSEVAKHVGNALPGPTAQAIGEKMLVALTEGALGAMSLSSDAVWVQPETEASS